MTTGRSETTGTGNGMSLFDGKLLDDIDFEEDDYDYDDVDFFEEDDDDDDGI